MNVFGYFGVVQNSQNLKSGLKKHNSDVLTG